MDTKEQLKINRGDLLSKVEREIEAGKSYVFVVTGDYLIGKTLFLQTFLEQNKHKYQHSIFIEFNPFENSISFHSPTNKPAKYYLKDHDFNSESLLCILRDIELSPKHKNLIIFDNAYDLPCNIFTLFDKEFFAPHIKNRNNTVILSGISTNNLFASAELTFNSTYIKLKPLSDNCIANILSDTNTLFIQDVIYFSDGNPGLAISIKDNDIRTIFERWIFRHTHQRPSRALYDLVSILCTLRHFNQFSLMEFTELMHIDIHPTAIIRELLLNRFISWKNIGYEFSQSFRRIGDFNLKKERYNLWIEAHEKAALMYKKSLSIEGRHKNLAREEMEYHLSTLNKH